MAFRRPRASSCGLPAVRRDSRRHKSVARLQDRRLRELADSRNQGDALVHSTKKAVAEYGDKVDAAEEEKIEAALKDLEEALKSTASDKAAIDAKIETLATASQKLGEKMYADMAAAQGAAGGANAAGAAGGPGAQAAPEQHDDVVDADFKKVKKD
jgi:molecular chaperone DnaK